MEDKINHPAHYTNGIECIDYIESQDLGYHAGNAIKYITRYRFKNGVEDLKKAAWYLNRLIKIIEVNGEDAADDNGWAVDCSQPIGFDEMTERVMTMQEIEEERHIKHVHETCEAIREAWNDPADWRGAPLVKPSRYYDDYGS